MAKTPRPKSGEGNVDIAVGSRGSSGASLVWKIGVWVMCLGVRSPSGGEAGREEGVIHKLRPGMLGSMSRVEKAGRPVLSWTAGRWQ